MADEYGVVDSGFVRKPTSVIQSDIEQSFKNIFGDSINLEPSSPEGQIIQVFTPLVNDLWELAQQAYNAYAPNLASGNTLDHLVKINGLQRSNITYSTAVLTVSGSDGVIVPAGSLVRSEIDTASGLTYVFATEIDVTIGASSGQSGIGYVNSICTTPGDISIGQNQLRNILTPIEGWDTVTNVDAAIQGSGVEEDPQLRKRREQAIGIQALSTVEAIEARINQIETVRKVLVLQNDTPNVVEDLKPYSIKAIVQGGRSEDEKNAVAGAIFNTKSPGIDMNGGDGEDYTETVTVIDRQGFTHDIIYAVPRDVYIYIRITTEVDDLTAPVDIGETIKQNVIDYFDDPITGYTIGDDVYYSRVYVPINQIEGHVVSSMTIGTSADGQFMQDISISSEQLARVLDGTDGTDPYVEVIVNRI